MLKALLLLALLTATDAPAVPKTEIVVPETAVTPGRQVRLSIKPIEKLENLVSVAYTWVITPSVKDDMDIWPDHTRVSFGSGLTGRTFHVTVVASYVFKTGEKITQLQTETEAEVPISEPPPLPRPPVPGPDPTPGPTPTPGPVAPVLPDGRFKLAKYIYDLCKNMPPAQCRRLADALSGVAKTAREGGYQTKAQVIAAIRQADITALGSDLEPWKPLLDHLAATTNTMKSVIVTAQDAGVMCEELATGLYALAPPAATRR
jgi:hypothetical protein